MKCQAFLSNDILTLDTGCMRRRFRWNRGALVGLDLQLKSGESVQTWSFSNSTPDCCLPYLPDTSPLGEGEFLIEEMPDTVLYPRYLRVSATYRLAELEIRRVFRLYSDCPAIKCDYYLRGHLPADTSRESSDLAQQRTLEDPNAVAFHHSRAMILDRLCPMAKHLELSAIRFYDISDYRNTLVERRDIIPYRVDDILQGNLLLIKNHWFKQGLFWLKEAPYSDIQIAAAHEDFIHRIGELKLVGIGLESHDVTLENWIQGYSVVIGAACAADDDSILAALRCYQNTVRPYHPQRDDMIMLNTWGDRNMDKNIDADFARAEIDAAGRLGITHFQLDAGWHKGPSPNYFNKLSDYQHQLRAPDYWHISPTKFPRGLDEIVSYAHSHEIELCLWFNPNDSESFRYWQDDVQALTDLYQRYGIRTFKIDGVDIPNKTAEVHFRRLLDTVIAQTDGQARFNLDITAGRRFGCHYFYEYGNFYLENRYTDLPNYYPHWTLRNLWMLSRFIPTQRLQIEFLNVWRDQDKYADTPCLSPHAAGFAFAFAVAMPAQPLAFFEASHLPEEAFALADLITVYKQHQRRLHEGAIWPIGDCPNGFNFSGFQSVHPDGQTGYLIVYRQVTASNTAKMRLLHLSPQTPLKLTALAGQAVSAQTQLDDESRLSITLDQPLSFAFYHYTVL